MPKSKFDKEKQKKSKLVLNMSMKERDKIKDVNTRLDVAKKQEAKKRSRTITAEDIAREKAEKEAESAPKIGGVKVKVRQSSGSTQKTETPAKDEKPRVSYAERKHQSDKLKHYREQLAVLTERANERVEILVNRGFESRALDAALASRPSSRGSSEPLFKSDLRTETQIKRELSRTMTFLNDPTSLSRGAEKFTEDFSAEGLFGGQYRAMNGKGYSDEVDEVIGETTLDLYHRILEQAGGWERVMGYMKANSGGLVEYGSENLINAIYDMVMHMGTSNRSQSRIIKRGVEMVNNMVKDYQQMAEKQRSGVDYGLLGYDEDADNMRNYWAWKMEREGIK